MKGRGGKLAQLPLRANVLFIMRVSEISCEVKGACRKEQGQRHRGGEKGDVGGCEDTNIPCSSGHASLGQCLLFPKGSHCRRCVLLLKSGCRGQGVGPGELP